MFRETRSEISYESSLRPGEIHHDLKVLCRPGAAWVELWNGESFFSITHMHADLNLIVNHQAGNVAPETCELKAGDVISHIIEHSSINRQISYWNIDAGNTRLHLRLALDLLLGIQFQP